MRIYVRNEKEQNKQTKKKRREKKTFQRKQTVTIYKILRIIKNKIKENNEKRILNSQSTEIEYSWNGRYSNTVTRATRKKTPNSLQAS